MAKNYAVYKNIKILIAGNIQLTMKRMLLLLLIASVTSCTKDQEQIDQFNHCDEISDDYTVYDGETIDCQFHYYLTEFNGEQFIELTAHCADLNRPFVINESCVDICEIAPFAHNSECANYLAGRERIEILFIQK